MPLTDVTRDNLSATRSTTQVGEKTISPSGDLPRGARPCATVGIDGATCVEPVPAGQGPQRCSDGHTTVGLPEPEDTPAQHHLAPVVVARWLARDLVWQRTTKVVVTRTHDGTERLLRRLHKDDQAIKYGTEQLHERNLVLTHHAKAEMDDESIQLSDVWAALLEGEVHQRQPWGKVRMRAVDVTGRPIHVVYRLNTKHEIVVVTAFVESELVEAVA
jgi:hypothetical protein